MIRFLLATLLALFPLTAFAQSKDTVAYVQQALTDMGHDPGPVDGAWGGKTRRALNALRGEYGLPESRDLGGSSIALIHRLRPTERTLPRAGELQTSAAARRAYLEANTDIADAHCRNNWGLPTLGRAPEPVVRISRALSPSGKISAADDWYSSIGERFAVDAMACLGHSDKACERVVDNVWRWAKADALQSSVSKSSSRFDQAQWIAGSVLRPMISSYAIARQLVAVPKEVDAQIVDWMFDRASHYYLPKRRTPRIFPNQDLATNHQVSSALTYGMAAALVGDRAMLETAIAKWGEAFGSLREDGSFPAETQRGAWALSYTGLQMNYVIGLAELAEHQGMPLVSPGNQTDPLHDAVAFMLGGFADYGTVVDYAKRNVASGDRNPKMPLTTAFEQYFGWVAYYQSRFGEHANNALFRDLKLDPLICSPEQIAERKATNWRCSELSWAKPPIALSDMLEGASLGHFNAGHMGACTHADRADLFDAKAQPVVFDPDAWSLDRPPLAWQPKEPRKVVFASEVLLNRTGRDDTQFNALIVTERMRGPGKGRETRFNLRGRASYTDPTVVEELRLIIGEAISDKTATTLRACNLYQHTDSWDGKTWPIVRARRDEKRYIFDNTDCIVDAFPQRDRQKIQAFLDDLTGLIADFVATGAIDQITNKAQADWLRSVADGESTIVLN